jgi:hypothetical protein
MNSSKKSISVKESIVLVIISILSIIFGYSYHNNEFEYFYYKHNRTLNNGNFTYLFMDVDLKYTHDQKMKMRERLNSKSSERYLECCTGSRKEKTCAIFCNKELKFIEKKNGEKKVCNFFYNEELINKKEIYINEYKKSYSKEYNKSFGYKKYQCSIVGGYSYFKLSQIDLSENQIKKLKSFLFENRLIITIPYLLIISVFFLCILKKKLKIEIEGF